jgi:hypothetical protein
VARFAKDDRNKRRYHPLTRQQRRGKLYGIDCRNVRLWFEGVKISGMTPISYGEQPFPGVGRKAFEP